MSLKDLATVTDTQRTYLAGIVDGEGCIYISKQRRTVYQYYTLFMTVANTDPKLMLWIGEVFGGNIKPRKPCKSNKRNVWTSLVASCEAEAIQRSIIPFMVGKRDQAELALKFRESYEGNRTYSGKGIPEEVADFRIFCFGEMKRLKVPRTVLEDSCHSIQ